MYYEDNYNNGCRPVIAAAGGVMLNMNEVKSIQKGERGTYNSIIVTYIDGSEEEIYCNYHPSDVIEDLLKSIKGQ